MAQKITADVRLTHSYIDQYSHLDQWETGFKFKVLGGVQVEEGNGYDYLGAVKHRVTGSKSLNQDKQVRALRDYFSHHGCSHERDCCGCVSTRTKVTKVKPGIFSVLISQSRNY